MIQDEIINIEIIDGIENSIMIISSVKCKEGKCLKNKIRVGENFEKI